MEQESVQNTKATTLKSILDQMEAIRAPENIKISEKNRSQKKPKNATEEENLKAEILNQKNVNRKLSSLVKRKDIELSELEDQLNKRLKIGKLSDDKVKRLTRDKGILLTKIGQLSGDIIRLKNPENSVKNFLDQASSEFEKDAVNLEMFNLTSRRKMEAELRKEKLSNLAKESTIELQQLEENKRSAELNYYKKMLKNSENLLTETLNRKAKEIEIDQNFSKEKFFFKILESSSNFFSSETENQLNNVEIAEKVFNQNMKQLTALMSKEQKLGEELSALRADFQAQESQFDEKHSKLQEEYELLNDELTQMKNFEVKEETKNLSEEEIKKLIKKYKKLSENHSSLISQVKEKTANWTKNLKDSSQKDYEVIQLRKKYEKLLKDYQKLDTDLANKNNLEFKQEVGIREQVIKEQGLQIQNLLYINFKLRGYIKRRLGEEIPDLDPSKINRGGIRAKEDLEVYNSIEGQVEQIKKLRQKLYSMGSSENSQSFKEEMTLFRTESVNNNMPYQNVLEKYQKSKNEVSLLQKEVRSWKESYQGLLKEKSDLQGKYRNLQNFQKIELKNLQGKLKSLEEVKSQLTRQLRDETNSNAMKEIDQIKKNNNYENLRKEFKTLKLENSNLKEMMNTLENSINEEDKIWEKVTIYLENCISENDQNLPNEQGIMTLLEELKSEIKESALSQKKEIRLNLVIDQLTQHSKMLEKGLDMARNGQREKFENFKNEILAMNSALNSEKFDEYLQGLDISSEMESYCPTIVNLKLKAENKKLVAR